ncbi:MAG: hypothetical protein MZW92_46610 [Comamonadaceae bacterium]|nr:hypothetical protein [Comamonadaceae bacterium]
MQQRKQIEAALQVSEERYALALRGSSDGLWEWNLQSGAMQLSPRWKSMLGLCRQRAGRQPSGHGGSASIRRTLRRSKPPSMRTSRVPARALRAAVPHAAQGRNGALGPVARHRDPPCQRQALSHGRARYRRHARAAHRDHPRRSRRRHGGRLRRCLLPQTGVPLRAGAAGFLRLHHRVRRLSDEPAAHPRLLVRGSEYVDDFEYDLPGTPCETVVKDGQTCFYREGGRATVSGRGGLRGLSGHSSSSPVTAGIIGHLVFLDKREMGEDMLIDSVYRIFTARAAAEMERMMVARTPAAAGGKRRLPVFRG